MRKRFWRNVVLIALAHVIALIALLRWAGETKAANAQEITWLSGSGEPETAPAAETEMSSPPPEPEKIETPTPAKSEIVLPTPTPVATPTPRPTPMVRATATPAKKAKPTSTPEKKKAKGDPTPAAKKGTASKIAAKKSLGESKSAKKSARLGRGDGTSGKSSGKSDAATASYYGNMLHDRFYRAWDQPQTVVASGVKLSALAKIRIQADGRVSDFKIVRPSGNVLVDESVAAAGKKITQVDALPAGMGNGKFYDVNISFALNSQ